MRFRKPRVCVQVSFKFGYVSSRTKELRGVRPKTHALAILIAERVALACADAYDSRRSKPDSLVFLPKSRILSVGQNNDFNAPVLGHAFRREVGRYRLVFATTKGLNATRRNPGTGQHICNSLRPAV